MNSCEKFHSAYQYNLNFNQFLYSISQPMQESFGIRLLSYRRFSYKGSLFFIGVEPSWVEHSFVHQMWNSKSFKQKRDLSPLYEPQFFFWPTSPETSDDPEVYSAMYTLGFWNGMNIYRKGKDYIESFVFSGSKENPGIINFYMTHNFLLNSFATYFLQRAKEILYPRDLNKLLIPTHFEDSKYFDSYTHNIHSFIDKIKIKKVFLSIGVSLSMKEIECLFYLSNGKTAKTIARAMNISPRTVENYIENIKLKTGKMSKLELVKLIEEEMMGDFCKLHFTV